MKKVLFLCVVALLATGCASGSFKMKVDSYLIKCDLEARWCEVSDSTNSK